MKINRITILLSVLLLPVFVSAQENKTTNNVLTEINESGVTFTIPDIALDSIDIVNIQNKIQQEVYNVLKDKKKQQLRKRLLEENRTKINSIYPSIAKEPLQKILTQLANMSNDVNYFDYTDAKYYEKAELNIELYTDDKTRPLTFDNSIFLFYERDNYDEGFSWNEWMILVYDTNTGNLKYRHDFSTNDKNITLTNLLNPEEKSVYKDNFR